MAARPVITAYTFDQRTFIENVTISGGKGVMTVFLLSMLSRLGTSGPNESLWAGVIVFAGTGLCPFYLSFVSDETDAGPVLKAMAVVLLLPALLSVFWSVRPRMH